MVWISTPPPPDAHRGCEPWVFAASREIDTEEDVMMWWYGMSGFGWFVMAAWWALVIAGIVWLVRSVGGHPDDRGSARRLLDERFAAGELSVEEYQQRRRTLG